MQNIIYSSFLNATGYGQSAYDYIRSLQGLNKYNIFLDSYCPINKNMFCPEQFQLFYKMRYNKNNEANIRIFHCLPEFILRKKLGKVNIAIITFETYEPPSHWVNILNKMHAIVVPSTFNYKIFNNMGIKSPIYHIPHCINFNQYNSTIKPKLSYSEFTFLFFASWRQRKGGEELIEAFLDEFTSKDNVRLVLKTDYSGSKTYLDKILKEEKYKKKDLPPISFECNILKDEELPSFFKSFDCLILPSKGEGFGLPALQSLAVGTPVIATYCSGLVDILIENSNMNLYPKGYKFYPKMDSYIQFKDKKWAFVAIQDIREKMRYAYNNINAEKKYVYNYRNILKNKFDYSTIANTFDALIQSL